MPNGESNAATVSVEIPVIPDPEEQVEAPEQVTVITPPPAESSDLDAATVTEMLDQRERLVRAELRNEELERQLAEMQASVAAAQVTADIALENVQDAVSQVEELSEGDPIAAEDDIEPTREHPFWRHP